MDKKKSSRGFVKIDSHESLTKFVEEIKNKIPKGVKVDRAFSLDETIPEDGIVIHARTFNLGLYIPFHPLIREILSRLGLVPTQLAPNCWRIMFGIIALNQICKINLGWNEFCHCYAVKQNSGGNYYFPHRQSTCVLVTGLPKSEQAWKLDDLISLKGDWERRPGDATDTHSVPRSKAAADHKARGFKPHDSDVKLLDIKKALDLLEKRNWENLVDHPAYLELHRESYKIADDEFEYTLLPATCPPYISLGGCVRSEEVDGRLFEKTTNILPSFFKKQKLMYSDSTTSSIAANNLVFPNPCSDYESTIPSEAADKSKDTIDNINRQGSKDQDHETSDQSKKNIDIDQLLQLFEEGRLQVAQIPFGEVQSIVYFLLKHIKELKATSERKDKDHEEWKLLEEEEPVTVRAETPGATNTESLKKGTAEESENLKKQVITELKECFGKFLGNIRDDMTQIKDAQAKQHHDLMSMKSRLSEIDKPLNVSDYCISTEHDNDVDLGQHLFVCK